MDSQPTPIRADARRNREALIAAARAAFADSAEPVALEEVARRAGVGIGTLYRNFPTREALVEATYAAELDEVTGGAEAHLAASPADLALRHWMDDYAAFAAMKRGIMDTLRAGWASGRIATPTTRARITATIGMFLERGVEDGSLRSGIPAEDVTLLLLGTFLSSGPDGSAEQRARMLDLLVDGLRPTHPSP